MQVLLASFEPRRDRTLAGWRFVRKPTRHASSRQFESQPTKTRGRYEHTLNAHPDRTIRQFGGHSIPKQFFKVVAYRRGGLLRAKACVVSQELLIDAIDRLHDTEATGLTDNEVNLYQVKLSTLKHLTGLDFGDLTAFEDLADENLEVEILRPLSGLTEVVL
jgi:DNA/RNA endonuclease G (NUC1)